MRIPIIAPLLLTVVLFSGCLSYREVELRAVDDVELASFDRDGLAVRVLATIHNPNGYRITVKDPDVDIFVDGTFVGKARLDSTITLDKRSTRSYSVPLHADLAAAGPQGAFVLLGAALKGEVLLGAKGTVTAQALLVRKRFPFELEQRVDLNER